ncbi:hypothetical protein [Halohasta litorea]|uniref:Uncharacterized protein n=1 Tax=Halohasta litorea TaxID=869891 RepID=A0ABD6DCJ5_9EURY|nr:hypothetical protein [Halohasta litorea]MEA1930291.1 hypothetical protein [Euryarchaeota archaeon]
MSNTEHSPRTNPMASMIALQRQSLKQGQQVLQQSMNAQKQAPRMWKDAIDSQRSVQKTGLEASRSLAKGMVEMMEATVPSDQSLVGEEDSDASEQQHEAFESLHQAVEDQFEAVDEISDQTWEAIEQQLDESTDNYAEFVDQSTSMTEESVTAVVDSLEEVESEMGEGMRFGVETSSPMGTTRMDTDIDDEETA